MIKHSGYIAEFVHKGHHCKIERVVEVHEPGGFANPIVNYYLERENGDRTLMIIDTSRVLIEHAKKIMDFN